MREQPITSAGTGNAIPAVLVERAKAGDRGAMTDLYEATVQEVYRTIHAMIQGEDMTLDIQQDTYATAFSHLDQLRDPARFLPWLRQIAVNQVRLALRRQQPLLFTELTTDEVPDLPDYPDESGSGSPELALDRKETSRLIGEILGELSDGQRLLVGMYYYEQIPIDRIAQDLKLSPGTVKTQLFRSRKKIEAGVRRLEQEGVKLFGMAPLPFLTALMHSREPVPAASRRVLQAALTESGAQPAVLVKAARPFLRTALGKVVLGSAIAVGIGAGVAGAVLLGRANMPPHEPELPLLQTVTDDTGPMLYPETPEDLPDPERTEDTEAIETDTPPESSEDLPPTEPVSPEPDEPGPGTPVTPGPDPVQPVVTEPQPTEPAPTEPQPTEPTDPEPTDPEPPPSSDTGQAPAEPDSQEDLPEPDSREDLPTPSEASDVTAPYPDSPGSVSLRLGETWTFTGRASPTVSATYYAELQTPNSVMTEIGRQENGETRISFTPVESGTYVIYVATTWSDYLPWANLTVSEGE